MNIIHDSTNLKILKRLLLRRIPEICNDLFLIVVFSIIHLFRKESSLNIVSAADHNYFKSVMNLFESLIKFESESKLIFYDLGLTRNQRKAFQEKFENVEYREFLFSKYPAFISSRDSDNKIGSYGWKPQIINECLNEYNSNTLWLDAGCIITKKLSLIKIFLSVKGLYVASSVGKIYQWTHKSCIEYLEFPLKYINRNNFAGGMVGVNPNKKIYKKLISEWAKLSIDKNAISPVGSSRLNHRQDQSILTLLIYLNKLNFLVSRTHQIFGITIHNAPDKVYVWPSKKKESTSSFLNEWVGNNRLHVTQTYKNAEYIIFSDLSLLKSIRSKCKNQKIFYLSNKELHVDMIKKLDNASINYFTTTNKDGLDFPTNDGSINVVSLSNLLEKILSN